MVRNNTQASEDVYVRVLLVSYSRLLFVFLLFAASVLRVICVAVCVVAASGAAFCAASVRAEKQGCCFSSPGPQAT